MAKRKTWTEKLHGAKDLPKVEDVPGKGCMLVPAPIEVDEIMARVPRGRVTSIQAIREELARKHHVDFACPMTTGIFAWIAAHAAEEARERGEKRITPWWRTLKTGGELNDKYPGGAGNQRRLLEAEGHTVEQRGKKLVLADAPTEQPSRKPRGK